MRRAGSERAWILLWAGILILCTLVIPMILVKKGKVEISWLEPLDSPDPYEELPTAEQPGEPTLYVPVYLSEQKRVEQVPLELYVRGVVAAEMPPDFELEALKAQAIAARTYIVRKIVRQDFLKAPVPGAWVSDTVEDQAYATEEQLMSRWGRRGYATNISRINRAVAETRGLIITYEGEPIDATYFSTSNGYTENSEEYWSVEIPYLRSVESPWDKELSPKYTTVIRMPLAEVMLKLGLQEIPASTGSKLGMAVTARTSGNRIKTIVINGTAYSGREVREKLGLPSAEFTWRLSGDEIEFTTYGYGHGVGMSQYGANGMAMQGSRAEEILTYYYQGVRVVHMNQINGWQAYAKRNAEGSS